MAMTPTLDDLVNRFYDRAEQDAWWETYWAASESERFGMALLLKVAAGI